jgi:hypothetical protein
LKPSCTLSIILASGLLGLQVCNSRQNILAAAFQSGEIQPTSRSMSFPPGQMPTAITWPQFLDSVRRIALAYTHTLPDFVCTQKIRRVAKFGEIGDWKLVDQIVAEVSYYEGMEHYKILKVDNKPPSSKVDKGIPGFLSKGDFGNSLYQLFAPESNTSFSMDGSDHLNKRKIVRARFYIPQNHSRFYIGLGGQKVTTAYGGRCWIDLASHRVVRLEGEAKDIPRSFPVERSSHSTEYDWVEVSGNKYWLPVRASVYLQLSNEGASQQVDFYKAIYGQLDPSGYSRYPVVYAKNDMEYKHYRKFGTETRLITDLE